MTQKPSMTIEEQDKTIDDLLKAKWLTDNGLIADAISSAYLNDSIDDSQPHYKIRSKIIKLATRNVISAIKRFKESK